MGKLAVLFPTFARKPYRGALVEVTWKSAGMTGGTIIALGSCAATIKWARDTGAPGSSLWGHFTEVWAALGWQPWVIIALGCFALSCALFAAQAVDRARTLPEKTTAQALAECRRALDAHIADGRRMHENPDITMHEANTWAAGAVAILHEHLTPTQVQALRNRYAMFAWTPESSPHEVLWVATDEYERIRSKITKPMLRYQGGADAE